MCAIANVIEPVFQFVDHVSERVLDGHDHLGITSPAGVFTGCVVNASWSAVPGDTLNALLVSPVSPRRRRVQRVAGLPALSTVRSSNIATPSTEVRVVVPAEGRVRVPPESDTSRPTGWSVTRFPLLVQHVDRDGGAMSAGDDVGRLLVELQLDRGPGVTSKRIAGVGSGGRRAVAQLVPVARLVHRQVVEGGDAAGGAWVVRAAESRAGVRRPRA